MKKTIVLFFIVFLLANITDAQFVGENGELKVEETKLLNKNNEPIVLRGVSFGWHNWWPRFYTPETVKWLVEDWNCNVVRAAIGVDPKKGYINKPEWSLKKLESIVNAAIEEDIYVIIDWHSHKMYTDEAKVFFTEMAQKYGKYPNVIYEIYNEPVNDSWEEVKSYSIEIIEAIRKFDSDNIILVGNPHWCQDVHLVADNPIEGQSNIMYTLHYYAATHKDELRERGDYALSKGIPLFISESAGMQADGNGLINYDKWNAWIEWGEKNKLSWITWSVADKNESCSFLYPSASSKGNWRMKDLRESGKATRELLIKMNK